MAPLNRQRQYWRPLVYIKMIEIDEMYIRGPYVYDVDNDHIWRIPSSLRGSVGICATSEAILIVLVLYLLIPPRGDYTIVNIHCKPWDKKQAKERNRNKIIKYIFAPPREVGSSDFPSGKSV